MSTIDLDQAETATKSLLVNNEQDGYQANILRQRDTKDIRYIYLPTFPATMICPTNCLILANVPEARLSSRELMRRQYGGYTNDAITLTNEYECSNVFHLLPNDIEELAHRLKVPESIITFTAGQLRTYSYYFLGLYRLFHRNFLSNKEITIKESTLNSKEMAQALEFYLQIDLEVFFMKTCSFRGAEPCSIAEGLFCKENEPERRYKVTACQQNNCCLCSHVNNDDSSMHEFINGYRTYLNCPATCTTSNVIYVLTCPCGKYDYIDSTSKTFAHAYNKHCEYTNRIIHEKLTGRSLRRERILDSKDAETEIRQKLRLYQHVVRCPVALRKFLDINPIYWCFIPLIVADVLTDNAKYVQSSSLALSHEGYLMATTNIENTLVAYYVDHVPYPPTGYAFTYQQAKQQCSYFQEYISTFPNHLPYNSVDLYHVAMIAVLPDNASNLLRFIIATLFIIHGQTKLNMICPAGGDPERFYGPVYETDWFANLKRPTFLTTATINILK